MILDRHLSIKSCYSTVISSHGMMLCFEIQCYTRVKMDVDILRGFLLRNETEEIKIIAESCEDKLNSIRKEKKVNKDETIRDIFVEGFILIFNE